MIKLIIQWSVKQRVFVLLGTVFLMIWGIFALMRTPLDAIPDLSDTQVIIRTSWQGQAPQVVENQITYPLTTAMLSVPHVKTVRGYSFFGDSFVYIIFEDKTDLYWARSRVLEYLNQVSSRLPDGVKPSLGPDATGVGWIYEYALVDKTGRHDLAQLRSIQDWFLKFELKTVPNVAEVATLGGMVKQFQVLVDPDKLRSYRVPLATVTAAIRAANSETGGSVLSQGEAEYMVRVQGYLQNLDDFGHIPISVSSSGTPILLEDIARVQIGPEMRRGIAELNGEGDVVGGVIILRSGQNAHETINAVKAKLVALQRSLPAGVEVVTTYDRSKLIDRAVDNLRDKLIEEFLVVAVVCAVFLWHLRSALVAIIALPLGVLTAFIIMYYQGINANIMSLGGIAIAIGAMVDAAIVMIENAHRKLEYWQNIHGSVSRQQQINLIVEAAGEVGPALFFSLLIITLSFIPVFSLEAQEGRLFAPLAYTKTYAMAAAAGLSVTLIPVLMTFFIHGHIRSEQENPLNRWLIKGYKPLLVLVLNHPKKTLMMAMMTVFVTIWPLSKIGSEFMPPLDEGDLLYMPTALPSLSIDKAAEIVQLTDRLIKTVPEVHTVFGKAGRAESATDPAPLEMLETTIQLKPRSEWRAGMTLEKLIKELEARLQVPGMANIWVQPIRNRIDMLATGIKSPVGIKLSGADLTILEKLGREVEKIVKKIPGASSVIAERVTGGRYIDIHINRIQAARYGLSIQEVQDVIATAVGGKNIGEQVDGLARFPINMRFPREYRDSLTKLKNLPLVTAAGATITLDSLATLNIVDGAPMIKSENARPNLWIYVDIADRDLAGFVKEARANVERELPLPTGYALEWSGQFEYFERAATRLLWVVPMTLAVIFILLFLSFSSITPALLILGTLPFALVGAICFLYLLGHNFSIATGVGMIALLGLAAEFGVIMLVYLDEAIVRYHQAGQLNTIHDLHQALIDGAVLRVRPKAMTVAVILAGLLPILVASGTGSEAMSRIAAPMIGGMLTAPLLSLFVLPAAYALLWQRELESRT